MKAVAALAVILALLALAPAAGAEEVLVSAAASLKPAFEEIGRRFEAANPGVRVLFNFGASGDLAAQIAAGAPVDVFVSASARDLYRLESAGLLAPSSLRVVAANRLVLVVPAASALGIDSFPDLAKPAVKRIAIGNPTSAPAGRYAEETLRTLGLLDAVWDRVVLAENVLQILNWCARGEVDAGVVYATDARSRRDEVRVAAEAPASSHAPILYPAAIVRDAPHGRNGSAFIALLLSPAGHDILAAHGFLPPPARAE
jgi:molybdate transport system substrate-binding protein